MWRIIKCSCESIGGCYSFQFFYISFSSFVYINLRCLGKDYITFCLLSWLWIYTLGGCYSLQFLYIIPFLFLYSISGACGRTTSHSVLYPVPLHILVCHIRLSYIYSISFLLFLIYSFLFAYFLDLTYIIVSYFTFPICHIFLVFPITCHVLFFPHFSSMIIQLMFPVSLLCVHS